MRFVILFHRILQEHPHTVHILARSVLIGGVILPDTAPGGGGSVATGGDDTGILLYEVAEEGLRRVDNQLKLFGKFEKVF